MTQIKFLQVFPFYQNYLNGFYSNNPNIVDVDYNQNHAALMSDCFGIADFWVVNLNKLGNYSANAVVFNDKVLQTKWAKEHQIAFSESNWVLEILEAQINELKPEVIFWNDCMFPNESYFNDFKKRFPFVKLLLGWDGVALNNLKIFKNFDIVLTCAQWIVDFYNSNQIKSYYVPHGFEESILEKIESANLKKTIYELTFCGSLNKGPHLKRYETLLAFIKAGLPLKIFTDAVFRKEIYNIEFLKKLLVFKHNEILDERLMMKNFKPSVYGLEMFNVLKNSKLSINIHIDKAKNEAANMRLFEITGVGSCMVTDWKENLSTLFKEDEEVVVFKSIDEAKDKIANLLRDDALRNKIALAGQKRTLRDYKFLNKVTWLDKTIQTHLNK
jgi:spore maturation protein CgeB